jgi:hypothetical protein
VKTQQMCRQTAHLAACPLGSLAKLIWLALPKEPIFDPDFSNVLMAGIREQEAQRIALV